MSTVLAIDPGTRETGWVLLDGMDIVGHGIDDNHVFKAKIIKGFADEMVIETVACYGMAVGKDVFETALWAGRFEEKWFAASGNYPVRMYRREVKMWLCKSVRATDANVRRAVMDKYPPTGRDGKGNPSVVGTKSRPGPLYGIKSHEWQALALGLTHRYEL